MKLLTTLILAVLCSFSAISQSNPKAAKAIKTFNDGKYDKGIKKMEKVLLKDGSTENWNTAVSMQFYRYKATSNIAAILMQMLSNKNGGSYSFGNSAENYIAFINTCKQARLHTKSAVASMYLRNFLIDFDPDTAVADTSKKLFRLAEEEFGEENFRKAIEKYDEALVLDSNYYKAIIYKGDCHWHLKEHDVAIKYFQKGIDMYPTLLEPRKYLVDALIDMNSNELAKKECLDAIFIYPDESMYDKYETIINREYKIFSREWIPRGAEINKVGEPSSIASDFVWKIYQGAKKDVEQYADSTGIITKKNDVTNQRYLEVYSFEKMLKNATTLPKELRFAKRMMDEGYLDCYVFFSMYHVDLYDQYMDFIKDNKEKVKRYIDQQLIKG